MYEYVFCSDLLAAENYLDTLPPQIGLLTNITRLRVTNNRLTSLPMELGNLCNMTELAVSDNELRELPGACVAACCSLLYI